MATATRRRTVGQVSGESIVIEAAWMYYHDGLNQGEIAKLLQVSRATVVNYLQEARERGYIRISLDPEIFTGHQLAQDLREKFALKAAFVLPGGIGGGENSLLRVARGAADWLPSLLESGDRLGVAWGRTVYEVAQAVEQRKMNNVTVSQLVGSMATPYGFTAEICSADMAQNLGANCINLHAPAVLSDPDLAARLRDEPIIHAQLEALSHCNKAIFAAGSCAPDSHIVGSGVASAADLDWYVKQGATGVLCGRFINAGGQLIPGELDSRMIGVTLDKLQGLKVGLLVSDGADKVIPMLSAIAGGYVTHIVTSNETARLMLDSAE
ncbi:Putative DAK transcriptional regulator / Putative dihydroxyacetone kinase, dihydroxyacetone binding subunit [hydrothermal vent metagenome]|uniref:DAK transcriptional regulator / Putative dihydroxyacetone kinase, dihydroxyacetone binding subunit n=1 Tax=hydrothermal vent metagenome TaxID=652676 RepID=A0A3B0U4X5_9ZZZZ